MGISLHVGELERGQGSIISEKPKVQTAQSQRFHEAQQEERARNDQLYLDSTLLHERVHGLEEQLKEEHEDGWIGRGVLERRSRELEMMEETIEADRRKSRVALEARLQELEDERNSWEEQRRASRASLENRIKEMEGKQRTFEEQRRQSRIAWMQRVEQAKQEQDEVAKQRSADEINELNEEWQRHRRDWEQKISQLERDRDDALATQEQIRSEFERKTRAQHDPAGFKETGTGDGYSNQQEAFSSGRTSRSMRAVREPEVEMNPADEPASVEEVVDLFQIPASERGRTVDLRIELDERLLSEAEESADDVVIDLTSGDRSRTGTIGQSSEFTIIEPTPATEQPHPVTIDLRKNLTAPKAHPVRRTSYLSRMRRHSHRPGQVGGDEEGSNENSDQEPLPRTSVDPHGIHSVHRKHLGRHSCTPVMHGAADSVFDLRSARQPRIGTT